ncbi:sn-1-specific diacylglycerol lipase ABHD11-like isoform X1 [Parasteatoda tepidariorum]|uniref:sn-1-specific diacylglycerol lipase ABHD11-like isoform X1 n=1 Tax=Parasteatoda tepidariorum TaxID=114398 RepID=UPI001C7180FD|nr:protein ABHD11-like isoform X1 [Parasteatoda tepidariorum]
MDIKMTNYTPVKIAYKKFEPSGGSNDKLAPVIFLHGLTSSKESWNVIAQIIADKTKRKTYACDARNHGESEYSEHFNFDLNVDDLFQFMNDLNIERAVLVGHSMGSFTSTNAALRKPERVEMVFSEDMYVKKLPKEVTDSVIRYASDFCEAVKSVPKDLSENEALIKAVKTLSKNNKEVGVYSSEESLKSSNFVLKRRSDGGYDVAFNRDPIIRAFQDPETLMTSPSGQFNGHAYFIYGKDSPIRVISEETHIKKHFPKAEFIELKCASHSVHLELTDQFLETVLSRLQ